MEIDLFAEVAGLSALAVVAVQQILKLKVVPVSFANKFPVLTNVLLSVVASVIVAWQTKVTPQTPFDWVLLVATISVVAAIVYNNTLANSDAVQELEGEGV